MLVILSPAKTLDFSKIDYTEYSVNPFLNKSKELISLLKTYSISELQELMKINNSLAALNFKRIDEWKVPKEPGRGKQAIFTYHGEVYNGLKASTLSIRAIEYAQTHLRILSGLYGVLRPLDLIAAYRLDMGALLHNPKGYSLYDFWNDSITKEIQKSINQQGDSILVNLASSEYTRVVNLKKLKARIITPEFREYKNGSYKTIIIYTKKARGLMARYIIENELSDPESIKKFDQEGYFYNETLSTTDIPVFTR